MSKRNILQYTMISAVILLLLSVVIENYNMKLLTLFFLMSIVINWITNDLYKSICISFFIILYFYLTQSPTYEGFENNEEDINVDNLLKELTDLASNVGEKAKDIDLGEDSDEKKDEGEIKEEDLDLLDDDAPKEGGQYVESAKAQRETFRLINTIKQLDDTVKNLAPTLKQGADIINKFKKLNLIDGANA